VEATHCLPCGYYRRDNYCVRYLSDIGKVSGCIVSVCSSTGLDSHDYERMDEEEYDKYKGEQMASKCKNGGKKKK